MKDGLRWTILLTQVGGGLIGILVTLGYLLKSSNMPLSGIVISIVFIGLYTFVAIAGVLFARDERRTMPLRLALWLQVPLISSPVFAWLFSAGFYFFVTWIGTELSVDFWVGSKWKLYLFTNLPWGFGINLFAVTMLVRLHRMHASQEGPIPSAPNRPEMGETIA